MAYITAGDQHREIINTGSHKVLTTGIFSADKVIYMHEAPMILCGGGGVKAPVIFFPDPTLLLLKDCPVEGEVHYSTDADFCTYAAQYPGIQTICMQSPDAEL